MDDLIAFLRARLDEDEQVARAAAVGGRWRYENGDSVGAWMLYDEHWRIADLATYRHDDYDYSNRMPAVRNPRYVDADANGAHIAHHDPARVLADADAKRKLVEFWSQAFSNPADFPGPAFDRVRSSARWTLKQLALPFDGHPEFREEWRPTAPDQP